MRNTTLLLISIVFSVGVSPATAVLPAATSPAADAGFKLTSPIIIPTPRTETRLQDSSWKPIKSVAIYVDDSGEEALRLAGNDLLHDLKQSFGDLAEVYTTESIEECKADIRVIVKIRNADSDDCQVPERSEAYGVFPIGQGQSWTVSLVGHDARGTLWATKTMKQLFTVDNSRVLFYPLVIRDYPYYPIRSVSIDHNKGQEGTLWTALDYKINAPYTSWFHIGTNWRNPPDWYRTMVVNYSRLLNERGLTFLQKIHPFWIIEKPAPGVAPYEKTFRLSKPEDLDSLLDVFRLSLDQGNKYVMLMFDDASQIQPPEEIAKFGSYEAIHAEVFSRFQKRLHEEYPDVDIIFLPRPYSGEPRKYLSHFKDMSDDVIMVWTGPSGNAVSLNYTKQAIAGYVDAIGHRRFVIHDNVPYQRYGLQRGIFLFDSYADGYNGLYKSCYGITATYTFRQSPLILAKGMIISDYLWNADRYNAKKTVRRVMLKLAGPKAVPSLLRFKKKYAQLVQRYPLEKEPGKLSDKEVKRYAVGKKSVARDKAILQDLKKSLVHLDSTCANPAMLTELEERYVRAEKLLFKIWSHELKVAQHKPQGNVWLDLETFSGGAGYTTYRYKCPPRFAVWAYGTGTRYAELRSNFSLTETPIAASLKMIAQCDRPENTMAIIVNGTPVYKGPCRFAVEGWGEVTYHLPNGLLREGKNSLVIQNTTNSIAQAAEWIMFSQIGLKFDE